ncbi:hypothetical protein A3849_26315 [Paenibacillus sp. P46E]|nr:hypothetical protein A3849_26315 [Paenibacillus sp. P46E]
MKSFAAAWTNSAMLIQSFRMSRPATWLVAISVTSSCTELAVSVVNLDPERERMLILALKNHLAARIRGAGVAALVRLRKDEVYRINIYLERRFLNNGGG